MGVGSPLRPEVDTSPRDVRHMACPQAGKDAMTGRVSSTACGPLTAALPAREIDDFHVTLCHNCDSLTRQPAYGSDAVASIGPHSRRTEAFGIVRITAQTGKPSG